jgi:hypothetical protein
VSGKGWSPYKNSQQGPTAVGMGNSLSGIMGMLAIVEETVDRNMLGGPPERRLTRIQEVSKEQCKGKGADIITWSPF